MCCCTCYTTTGLSLLYNRSFWKHHTLIWCRFYHAIILFLCKSDEKYHSWGWSLWVVGISREKTIVPQTLSKTRFILQTQSINKKLTNRQTDNSPTDRLSLRLDPSNTYFMKFEKYLTSTACCWKKRKSVQHKMKQLPVCNGTRLWGQRWDGRLGRSQH